MIAKRRRAWGSLRHEAAALAASVGIALVGCGGGGGGSAGTTPVAAGAGPSASSAAMSSGSITAFGSIFVNGHEFATNAAKVIDDDAGTQTTGTSSLEVGMSVDVKPASASTDASPVADEVHLHPLARGFVDASDSTAGTLSVMGQAVQLMASTNFSDHRACAAAATPTCPAVTGQSGLTATTGSGGTAVAGSYVTVWGYLYSDGSAPGTANIVATLVSVADAPSAVAAVAYKAEGVATAVAGSVVTIGGLSVDLSAATCRNAGVAVACNAAFGVGQVVAVFGAAAPSLPAASFTAATAVLRTQLAVETAGASIELEGKVSSVSTAAPASFVVRGVTVDASTLPLGSILPAVGDLVRVAGTVTAAGISVATGAVEVLHAARSATYGFEGDAAGVAPGATAGTYTLTVLGETVLVDAGTRLADRSVHGGGDPSSNPFNIDTFQAYLAASASQHLLVRTQADANGNLSALAVVIVPASTVAAVSGVVDGAPAPITGGGGSPSTFAIHGVTVSADPATIGTGIFSQRQADAPVAAGDLVLARGTYAAGVLTVTAPATPVNLVIDDGTPVGSDHDCF